LRTESFMRIPLPAATIIACTFAFTRSPLMFQGKFFNPGPDLGINIYKRFIAPSFNRCVP
jgi:hypothetical protein